MIISQICKKAFWTKGMGKIGSQTWTLCASESQTLSVGEAKVVRALERTSSITWLVDMVLLLGTNA